MTVINNNLQYNFSASKAQAALDRHHKTIMRKNEEMSTGSRVSNPSYDVTSYSSGKILNQEINILNHSSSNTSLAQQINGLALNYVDSMIPILEQMKSVSTQANAGHLDASAYSALDYEYQQLMSKLSNLVSAAQWNGQGLFNTTGDINTVTTFDVTVGVGNSPSGLSIFTMSFPGINLNDPFLGSLPTTDLQNQTNAQNAQIAVKSALDGISSIYSTLAAQSQNLTSILDSIHIQEENAKAAQSILTDADILSVMSDATQYQYKANAAEAVLQYSLQKPAKLAQLAKTILGG
jgi:flagellin